MLHTVLNNAPNCFPNDNDKMLHRICKRCWFNLSKLCNFYFTCDTLLRLLVLNVYLYESKLCACQWYV